MNFAALVFCRDCGSAICDVNHWSDNTRRAAVIKCYDCGNEGELTGFSVGRARFAPVPAAALAEARSDAPHLRPRLTLGLAEIPLGVRPLYATALYTGMRKGEL